ncbi:MAG: tetratricopeptide repeat protein [Erythrobacter sp.]|nr:MAG: tetratricopeptide repeat protein [Erythrobacter sp.]
MREVDEAVRQDQAASFAKRYGVPIGGAVVLALAAFGGFLWWQESRENALEEQSEALVQAMDELDAGNVTTADEELAALSEGTDGAAAVAAMLRAGIALQQDRPADAVVLFDRVANNAELPQELRDVAAIRSVSAQYDDLDPQAVIDRLGPLAQADSPYFGSAGELVAHAYLAQGKNDQAGPLLVAIARSEDVPQSIRGRTRQLAGLLGFDAIEDVDAALAEITGEEPQDAAVELAE